MLEIFLSQKKKNPSTLKLDWVYKFDKINSIFKLS